MTVNRRLIGLTGLKRAGKDTVAEMLNTHFIKSGDGLKWDMESFAGPLKELCYQLFGITEENRQSPIFGMNITGRELQQKIGTEVGRAIDPNLWVESMRYRIGGDRADRIILTDVRFENEARMIKELGGIVVHVIRPTMQPSNDPHQSEAGIPSSLIDYSIVNDADLSQLAAKVVNFGDWFISREIFLRQLTQPTKKPV